MIFEPWQGFSDKAGDEVMSNREEFRGGRAAYVLTEAAINSGELHRQMILGGLQSLWLTYCPEKRFGELLLDLLSDEAYDVEHGLDEMSDQRFLDLVYEKLKALREGS